MGRNLDIGSGRDPCGLHPSGNAADTGDVRHDVVAGTSRERLAQASRSIEIFADLDGCPKLTSEPGVTPVILVSNRLLKPDNIVVVERMPALQRLGWGKSLVVVHHNRD